MSIDFRTVRDPGEKKVRPGLRLFPTCRTRNWAPFHPARCPSRMKAFVGTLMAALACLSAASAQNSVSCSCRTVKTVCLSDIEMSRHAVHVEMQPDLMGNHSNYRGVAVFQIGFNERGRVTDARAISGHPLGISNLIAAASKWRFKPVVVKGQKKKACGRISIKFQMNENVPWAKVLQGSPGDIQ